MAIYPYKHRWIFAVGFMLLCFALRSQSFDDRVYRADAEDYTVYQWRELKRQAPEKWLPFISAILEYKSLPYPENAKRFEKAFEQAHINEHESVAMLCAKHAAAQHLLMSETEAAAKFTKQCLKRAEVRNKQVFGHCLLQYGLAQRHHSNFDSAYILFDSAMHIFNALGYEGDKAYAHFNIGSALHHQQRLDSAIGHYLLAAERFEKRQDSMQLGKVYNNIGIVFTTLRNYAQAVKYVKLSMAYRAGLSDSNAIATSLISLGNIKLALTEWDSADFYFKKGLEINEKIGNRLGVLHGYNNIANAAYYGGDYHRAFVNFDKALKLAFEVNDSIELSRMNANMGWSLLSLNRADEALPYFQKGLEIALKIDALEIKEVAYSGMSDYYLAIKDFEKALDYYSKSRDVADRILNAKQIQQIQELRARYETEKKEGEIIRLDRENTEAKLKLARQRSWLVGTILGVIMLAGLIWFFYYQRQQRIKSELAQKELLHKKDLLRSTLLAQEEERQRIAKDLHDGLVQDLAVVKMGLERVKSATHLDEVGLDLIKMQIQRVDQAADDARSLSHQMMPRALEEAGLAVALEDMLKKVLTAHNISYSFETFGMDDQRFERQIEVGIYRIAQEMVNNIIKHSGAKKVFVQLIKTQSHLILHLEDDGEGFEPQLAQRSQGIGMGNILSRASLVNGEVNFEALGQNGTAANVRVPIGV